MLEIEKRKMREEESIIRRFLADSSTFNLLKNLLRPTASGRFWFCIQEPELERGSPSSDGRHNSWRTKASGRFVLGGGTVQGFRECDFGTAAAREKNRIKFYIRRHTGMSWLASPSIRKKALTLLLRPQKRHLPRAKGWISTFGTEPPRDSGSIYYN
ncbi:hypothetical protein BJV77DRAFT_963458 [Russula vinacea]|nr:hypothetical protein BJV77DRAFT_963458 [Russula vinacea]